MGGLPVQYLDGSEPEDNARAEISESGDESQVRRVETTRSLVLTRRSAATDTRLHCLGRACRG